MSVVWSNTTTVLKTAEQQQIYKAVLKAALTELMATWQQQQNKL